MAIKYDKNNKKMHFLVIFVQ